MVDIPGLTENTSGGLLTSADGIVENVGGASGITTLKADMRGNPFLRNVVNVPTEAGFFDLAGHSFNGLGILDSIAGETE